MLSDKCCRFSKDLQQIFENNNGDKKSTTSLMTIIKIYNQINKEPFQDVQTDV